MKLRELYQSTTGESASETDLTRELHAEPPRRRRAVLLRKEGATWRTIGHELNISHGSARSLVLLALRAIRKRLLKLPRYHQKGHPGPPEGARWTPATPPPKRGRGKPPLPRCKCGKLTKQQAGKLGHRC